LWTLIGRPCEKELPEEPPVEDEPAAEVDDEPED
jgi:hypothetical protein